MILYLLFELIVIPNFDHQSTTDFTSILSQHKNKYDTIHNLFSLLLQENMVKEEVEINHRVHSMIIGRRGTGIRKIMSDFSVDIRLPRQGDPNPDLVTVTFVLFYTFENLFRLSFYDDSVFAI